jgi:hypothetical protein
MVLSMSAPTIPFLTGLNTFTGVSVAAALHGLLILVSHIVKNIVLPWVGRERLERVPLCQPAAARSRPRRSVSIAVWHSANQATPSAIAASTSLR